MKEYIFLSGSDKITWIQLDPDPTSDSYTGYVHELLHVWFLSAALVLSGVELSGGRQREHGEAAVRAHADLVPVSEEYFQKYWKHKLFSFHVQEHQNAYFCAIYSIFSPNPIFQYLKTNYPNAAVRALINNRGKQQNRSLMQILQMYTSFCCKINSESFSATKPKCHKRTGTCCAHFLQ